MSGPMPSPRNPDQSRATIAGAGPPECSPAAAIRNGRSGEQVHIHRHFLSFAVVSRRHRGLLLGGLLTALVLGCGLARIEDGSSFDVLIYVLDACRADRIGAYG